jgi:hypothetical protein
MIFLSRSNMPGRGKIDLLLITENFPNAVVLCKHFSETLRNTIHRFRESGSVQRKCGSGRLRKLFRLSNVDQGKWQTTICLPIKRSGRLPNPRHVGNGCGGLQFMCGGREAHRLSRCPPTRGCQFDRISTKSGRLRPLFSG